MTNPTDPKREHPSTYFVQDRSNIDEMTRVEIQGQMVTAGMGGVLPEQPDPARFQSVLDVGCGTGDWLIQAAKTYPGMSRLVGGDISTKILDYARAQAQAQQVEHRVEFLSIDALRMLEFPAASFDLVNQRFGMSYLRTWDWPKLLGEYQRVCKPGGVIRVTECKIGVDSNSPALTRVFETILEAFHQAGHFFTPTRDGVINQLPQLMGQYAVQDVQTRSHLLEYRFGTDAGNSFYEDMKYLFRTIVPFIRKWTRIPDDFEATSQQALVEMQQPDFHATWPLLTVWGTNPTYETS